MAHTAPVIDVSEVDFRAQVLEASRSRTVVVDFWAPWCGPCRQLSPLLERVAARYSGEVGVAKVNVDEAPALARRYRVQGIPAVKAFRDGRVVAEFTGAQPEPFVEQFFAGLAPTLADRLVAEAAHASVPDREHLLRRALEEDAGHAKGIVALARLLVDRDERQEARALLDRVPADADARRLRAELELSADAGGEQQLDELRSAAGAGDAAAQLRLGNVLAARGDHAGALAAFVDAARRPGTRDEARSRVLAVFALLGDDHELVRAWRPKLASALF